VRNLAPEWKAIVCFQETLAKMVPVDITAYVTTAKVDMHPLVLLVLAQLWLPDSLTVFIETLGPDNTRVPSATQIAEALLTAAQKHENPVPRTERARLSARAIFHEQGMQRFFGPSVLASRLGLGKIKQKTRRNTKIEQTKRTELGKLRGTRQIRRTCKKAKRHTGALTLSEPEGKQSALQRLGRVEDLLALLPAFWPVPTSLAQLETHLLDLESLFSTFPDYFGFKGHYIRKHVLRKLCLLYLNEPALKSADLESSVLLAKMAPDKHGLLPRAGRTSGEKPSQPSLKDIMAMTPALPPALLSMWACSFHSVLKARGAAEWVAKGDCDRFRDCAASLAWSNGGCPPTPGQVIRAARDTVQMP
jgi:hypothetical protein